MGAFWGGAWEDGERAGACGAVAGLENAGTVLYEIRASVSAASGLAAGLFSVESGRICFRL